MLNWKTFCEKCVLMWVGTGVVLFIQREWWPRLGFNPSQNIPPNPLHIPPNTPLSNSPPLPKHPIWMMHCIVQHSFPTNSSWKKFYDWKQSSWFSTKFPFEIIFRLKASVVPPRILPASDLYCEFCFQNSSSFFTFRPLSVRPSVVHKRDIRHFLHNMMF